jgi:plasmid stability protein
MKSITVHGVSEEAAKLLRKRAKGTGRSVNKVMKELIDRSLGLEPGKKDNRAAFVEFCGVWTEEEAKAFLDAIDDLERIDEADWR